MWPGWNSLRTGKYLESLGGNRRDRSITDKKVTRAQFNETYLEDLSAVWAPLADCG